MSDSPDLLVFKGSKKGRCPYCGGEKHITEWACPRIIGLDLDPDTGKVTGITFGDMPEPPPIAS
jgi:RNA polymerase subunit RPABC4/transcription elongation factor Spt4